MKRKFEKGDKGAGVGRLNASRPKTENFPFIVQWGILSEI